MNLGMPGFDIMTAEGSQLLVEFDAAGTGPVVNSSIRGTVGNASTRQ